MGEFVQQVIATLTSFPGNLVYHLILAFSVAGAFQAAMNLWRTSGFPQGRRMVLGLGLLLVARIILFIGAIVDGKVIADSPGMLPVLERSLTALGLILIVWLWAFPEPIRLADAATSVMAILTISGAALSLAWWWGNSGDITFNQTWIDIGWEIYSIMLAVVGIILLLVRKPNAWGIGLAVLGILSLGHISQLINPQSGSDIPGSVRLAQIAAYPLLLALPHRFQIPTIVEPSNNKPIPLIQERVKYSVNPQIFKLIISISTQKSFSEVCQKITETIANVMLADICLVVLPPNKDGQITIQSGYDLIREKKIPMTAFDGHDVPMLLSAMERASTLRLPASSTSHDLLSLGKKLQVGRAGHLLATFAKNNDDSPIMGILLLSPYSNRSWNIEDQKFLSDVTKDLVQILQRDLQWRSFQNKAAKELQNMQKLKALLEETKKENAGLRSTLSDLSQQPLQKQDVIAVVPPDTPHQSLELIKRLQAENLRLEELIEKLLAESQAQLEKPSAQHIEEELHLALEEIALLKSRLAIADQELVNPQVETSEPLGLSDQQHQVFTSIAQELRQPMSSIIGYTDLLLGESIGILGALQRKFLERVRVSADRMQAMLDDLFQVVSIEGDQLQLKPEMIDLSNIIDEAILATSSQLRDRHIVLRVDLPEKLPQLQADRDALEQIFFHLLKNAEDASPIEGEILLRASTYKTNDNQEYVLIQFADQGGGIPTQDLPRVFSRAYRADNPLIEGVGNTGVGLSIAKTLVEAHNGRIWVDTEPGKGSTFSVLIPLLNGNSGDITI